MQRKSSHFVKIRYFDKGRIWEALKRLSEQLSKKNPEIEKILVFGSFVRGQCGPGSDVDLLIILKSSDKPFLERITRYLPSKFPVGVDVFPYTREEIKKMLKENNFFLKKAMKEGIEI